MDGDTYVCKEPWVLKINQADMQINIKGVSILYFKGSASSKYAWRQAYKYKGTALHSIGNQFALHYSTRGKIQLRRGKENAWVMRRFSSAQKGSFDPG